MVFNSLACTPSKLFTTAHLVTSSAVPSPHPSPPTSIPNPNSDEIGSLGASYISDGVDLHSILPDIAGLEERQCTYELRLRKLV